MMTLPTTNGEALVTTAVDFDRAPLSWVIDEVRETLSRSRAALVLALEQQPVETTCTKLLRQAKAYLHQVHGAIQVVGVDGVALLTETVEDMLDRMASGQLTVSTEIVAAIGHSYDALVEYLQELLLGEAPQPIRLFPYYRDLLQARGAERIHPADLFFPNLAICPALPSAEPAPHNLSDQPSVPPDYIALRKRFEKALLPFLKGTVTVAATGNSEQLHDIIGEVEHAQTNQQLRNFWRVMGAFAEAVALGKIDNDLYVKQLFARINLQIRRLSDGSGSIAERLLRDALFFIARVTEPTPTLLQIRNAYELDGQVPTDFSEKRYGKIDSAALSAFRERLARAKNIWNQLVGGNTEATVAFAQEMLGLSQAGEALEQPSLAKLLRELNGIARAAASGKPSDRLGMEMATSLLFVENALAQIGKLPEDFGSRAEAMTARVLSSVAGQSDNDTDAPAPWLDDMSRLAQQRQTIITLAGELQTSLQQVEKMLEDYFTQAVDTAPLAAVDAILHQVGGVLTVLDQDDAALAVASTQEALQNFFEASVSLESNESQRQFTHIARNIGALGFFVETLQLHDDHLEKRFFFDSATGVFQAAVFERIPAIPKIAAPAHVESQTGGNLSTVEDDLLFHQQQAALLGHSLSADPGNIDLQAQLKQSLQQVRRDASLIDHPEANERASDAIALLNTPDFGESETAPAQIVAVTALQSTTTVLKSTPTPVSDQSDEEIDAELLEIFLNEALEVLDAVNTTLPIARQEPHSQEQLTILRRAFHTLKGSGRMVGLTAFGAAAWSIEQVLNLRLAQGRAGDAELYALLELAATTLSGWVNDLQNTGHSDRLPDTLVSAAASQGAKPPADRLTADGAPAVEKTSVIDFPQPLAAQPMRNDNVRQIGNLEISVPLHNIYMAETDGLVRLLALDFAEWRHEFERPVNLLAAHAAHSLAGTSATVGFTPLREVAQALEAVLQQLVRTPVQLMPSEFDLLDEVVERIRFMLKLFALGEMAEQEPSQISAMEHLLEVLRGRADAPPGLVPESDAQDDVPTMAALLSKQSAGHAEPAESAANQTPEPKAPIVTPSLGTAFNKTSILPEPPLAQRTTAVKDELDADLMPVFLEEANDMLPEMGRLLRAWQSPPGDATAPPALLRLLHTIKGSARMAGAMRFGQHMHDMESRIEQVMHLSRHSPQIMEDLLSRHDHGLQMFDALQHPNEVSADASPEDTLTANIGNGGAQPEFAGAGFALSAEAVPSPATASTGDLTGATGFPERRREHRMPADVVSVNSTPIPLVRVRADILDRLANQAGEVSIARSRLENEVGAMRLSLVELTENISRLREQLREVEMQAESQISSRRENSPEKQFDPLEFDRFTRLQELTRMMAESVNDVGAVQQTLTRTLDSASIDLGMQARLTRDLQQDLMSVRMVQFASVTERLYRVTRQASKEVDKRVSLDIRGSAVEIDRGVLEKMAGPFEHLLRNAIVHGIESRAARQAAGKSDIGELQIEVRQEGNEVVIEFSDDGQGLSLERIREKAQQTGLLDADHNISDDELTDLIFHPGFSTAAVITELAGRGIGMDVVRAEAISLGGKVAVLSVPGKGAQFTVHLPLTLAVTQVVLLTAGGKTYAVPSVLVEQVQQLKAPALAAAYGEGAVIWQSQRVPMVYLPTLLGEGFVNGVAQQYSPLIILKSGSNRLAVHVDEVLGNREVVVKNIGPQLARLAGIAGATVLGSGEIVLILNPLALAQRAAQEQVPAPRRDVPPAHTTPATHLGARPIVMVVDDSLTVRKVTQRLLSREGYQVVLAKDGIDALEQLQSITPDVMLVDIEMPRMDGFDLTRNLRGDERTRHIPIVMITSRSATKHRNHAFELGVNEYLGKPYQEEALLATIAGFVRKSATAIE